MKKVGIFFGSSTGYTEEVAGKIAEKLGVSAGDVHDISEASAGDADQYEVLLLGSSTWGISELQDDWYDFKDDLKGHLAGKEVGLFGTGDCESYDDTFCDAVGILYDEFQGSGCTFIGAYKPEGYNYSVSSAERDGLLLGLLLDEVNQDELSDERMDTWIAALGLK